MYSSVSCQLFTLLCLAFQPWMVKSYQRFRMVNSFTMDSKIRRTVFSMARSLRNTQSVPVVDLKGGERGFKPPSAGSVVFSESTLIACNSNHERLLRVFRWEQNFQGVGQEAFEKSDRLGSSNSIASSDGKSSSTTKMFKIDLSLNSEVIDVENFCASPIMRLPDELLGNIVLYLKPPAIVQLATSCRRFLDIISQNHIWQKLSRNHFRHWNDRPRDEENPESNNKPIRGDCWKRQYCINYNNSFENIFRTPYRCLDRAAKLRTIASRCMRRGDTKAISYHLLGSGNSKRRNPNQISDTPSAYGYKKLCSTRDHVFALDMANRLHVFRSRWERDAFTNEFVYKRTEWHQEFAKHVIDVTTDPRYDNNHRRYVYVLTQSEAMRSRRNQPNTRSSSASGSGGWNDQGNPVAGDKIDVFDERSCRRVFNMTFDPEMRFVSMKLTSFTPQQKTLYILTDAGKVYSLHLYESSLLNLGSEGMQVTLKSASKTIGEKIAKVETSVGVVGFITESGKLYVIVQRKSEFADIFGRHVPVKLGLPQVISNVAKVVHCSIGDRHLGFIDEYNRAFLVGNNRYGQLGTGDRMDRSTPVQVLCGQHIRLLYCSLNHTIALLEIGDHCEMLGTGCGHNGRLPGRKNGSVEFVKLDVKVPWGTRQIDAHKECLFLLACYDTEEPSQYIRQAPWSSETSAECLAVKSHQELLIELKKSTSILNKIRAVEAMVNNTVRRKEVGNQKINFAIKRPAATAADCPGSKVSRSQAASSNQQLFRLQAETEILKKAIEQLRLEAERLELDKHILGKQAAGKQDTKSKCS